MADSIAEVDLEWRIGLARKGDGKPLAQLLLWKNADRIYDLIPRNLRAFLVKVVAGKIILKRPLLRTRTYIARSRHWLREQAVTRAVEMEMRAHGKLRDKGLRTLLTRKWSKVYGTTVTRVDAFRDHKPKPLTAGARAAAKVRKPAQQ